MTTLRKPQPPAEQLREQLQREIVNIPDSRLQEIYDVIHFFRLGLKQAAQAEAPANQPDVMRFAGSWQDLPDFERFQQDIAERRRHAFQTSRGDEASTD